MTPWDVWDCIRAFGDPKTEQEAKARQHFDEEQDQLTEVGFADRVEMIDPRNPNA